jgi:hypothetical protein
MSLYNMLHGENRGVADIALACLNLTRGDTGRYRDCWLEDGKIVIHTRNGGGNRDDYEDVFNTLSGHPDYLGNQDDDFDCTYADITFRWPEAHRELLAQVFAVQGEVPSTSERWQAIFAQLESMKREPSNG